MTMHAQKFRMETLELRRLLASITEDSDTTGEAGSTETTTENTAAGIVETDTPAETSTSSSTDNQTTAVDEYLIISSDNTPDHPAASPTNTSSDEDASSAQAAPTPADDEILTGHAQATPLNISPLTSAVLANADEVDAQIAETQNKLASAKNADSASDSDCQGLQDALTRITTSKKNLADAEAQLDDLLPTLDSLNDSVASSNSKISSLNKNLNSIQADLLAVESQIESTQAQYDAAVEQLPKDQLQAVSLMAKALKEIDAVVID